MKTTILIFTALLVQISCQAVSPDKGEMRKNNVGTTLLSGDGLEGAKRFFEKTLEKVAKEGGPNYSILSVHSATHKPLIGAALKDATKAFKKNLEEVTKNGGPNNRSVKPLIGAALKGAKKAFKNNLEEVTKNGGPNNRILSVHSTTLKPLIGAALKGAKKAFKKNLVEVAKKGGPIYRSVKLLFGAALRGAKKAFKKNLVEVAKKGGPNYRILRVYFVTEDLGNGTLRTFSTKLRDLKKRKNLKCTVKILSNPGKNKQVTFKCDGIKEIVQEVNSCP